MADFLLGGLGLEIVREFFDDIKSFEIVKSPLTGLDHLDMDY